LFAEVQQSSDATFRLFDWNRPGLDGRPRPLQIELGLDAVNWEQGPVDPSIPDKLDCLTEGVVAERLCKMSAFTLERYRIETSFPVPHPGEFTIWMILDGEVELRGTNSTYARSFTQGETILLPASSHDLTWSPLESGEFSLLLCARLPGKSQKIPR
jgi:mannose-6-phosphate isomerase